MKTTLNFIAIMGDAAFLPEHVLIIFYQSMPVDLKEVIRDKFSDAEVTIYDAQPGVPVPSGNLPSLFNI